MVERLVERQYTTGFGGSSAFAGAAIGQGIFAALLMLMTLQVVFLAPVVDRGRDQPRAREADARAADRDPDQLAGDRRRQAAVGAGLRLPAHRRVDPADGRRLRVRRRRARGRPARLHRARRRGPRPRLVRRCCARASSSGRTAATAITIFGVLADHHRDRLRPGLLAGDGPVRRSGQSAAGCSASARRPILAYLNPFIAQADVMCGTETTFGGGWCGAVNGLVPTNDGDHLRQRRRAGADADADAGAGPSTARASSAWMTWLRGGGVAFAEAAVAGRAASPSTRTRSSRSASRATSCGRRASSPGSSSR